MIQQSISRNSKKPLDTVNRSEDSDHNSSSGSSKSSSNTRGKSKVNNISVGTTAFLNHDALLDKENEASCRSQPLNAIRNSIPREISATETTHTIRIHENNNLNDSIELDQIYNNSKTFTDFDREKIEKIQSRIDITGRTCLPCRQSPPCILGKNIECQTCFRPNVFHPAQSGDAYNHLLIQVHKEHDERRRANQTNPIMKNQRKVIGFSSSSGSAFHSPYR